MEGLYADTGEGRDMLVITVDLWPRGAEQRRQRLALMTIVNNQTGTSQYGNYNCCLSYGDSNNGGVGEVKRHPRNADVFQLIGKALKACRDKEN